MKVLILCLFLAACGGSDDSNEDERATAPAKPASGASV